MSKKGAPSAEDALKHFVDCYFFFFALSFFCERHELDEIHNAAFIDFIERPSGLNGIEI